MEKRAVIDADNTPVISRAPLESDLIKRGSEQVKQGRGVARSDQLARGVNEARTSPAKQ